MRARLNDWCLNSLRLKIAPVGYVTKLTVVFLFPDSLFVMSPSPSLHRSLFCVRDLVNLLHRPNLPAVARSGIVWRALHRTGVEIHTGKFQLGLWGSIPRNTGSQLCDDQHIQPSFVRIPGRNWSDDKNFRAGERRFHRPAQRGNESYTLHCKFASRQDHLRDWIQLGTQQFQLSNSERPSHRSFIRLGRTHVYARPMAQYLNETFPGRLYVHFGDSTVTVPQFIRENPNFRCDFILVDGGHTYEVAKADLE